MTTRPLVVAALAVGALCIPGCSGTAAPQAAGGVAASAAVPTAWTMPDLVGSDLQTAQDRIQDLTGFGIAVSTSRDLTGHARMQVFDHDWRVCTQSVAAGTEITADTMIDLGVVRLQESC